jgi:hypothetical protein
MAGYVAPTDRLEKSEDTISLRLHVELVYDPECPNVDAARRVLARVLRGAGLPAVWTEWRTDDPTCPESHLGYGSPTVLVNGDDVAPGPHPWARAERGDGPRCRIYREGSTVSRAPPEQRVAEAVQAVLGPDVV